MRNYEERTNKDGTVSRYVYFRVAGRKSPVWRKVPDEFVGKRGAARFLAKERAEVQASGQSQALFSTAASEWLELTRHRTKASTWECYDRALRLHVLPVFGAMPLRDIRPRDIQQFVNSKADQVAKRYLQSNIMGTLRSILDHAVANEDLDRNPAKIRLIYPTSELVRPPQKQRALTPQDIEALLSHADPRVWPIFVTAIWTGMRIGEILAMKWEYLDVPSQRYNVQETLTRRRTFTLPKSRSSRDSVPLSAYVCQMLTAHRTAQAAAKLEAKDWTEHGLIFPRHDGFPHHHRTIHLALHRTTTAADIGPVRIHDLRHTCASLLIAQGVPAKTVSRQLRHASITITLDTYGHLYPQQENEAVSQLDTMLGVG